jgi:hypothetical protein
MTFMPQIILHETDIAEVSIRVDLIRDCCIDIEKSPRSTVVYLETPTHAGDEAWEADTYNVVETPTQIEELRLRAWLKFKALEQREIPTDGL